jgi:hypothetical protein
MQLLLMIMFIEYETTLRPCENAILFFSLSAITSRLFLTRKIKFCTGTGTDITMKSVLNIVYESTVTNVVMV